MVEKKQQQEQDKKKKRRIRNKKKKRGKKIRCRKRSWTKEIKNESRKGRIEEQEYK